MNRDVHRTRRVDLRRFPAFATISVLLLVFLYLPLLVVVVYAFNTGRIATIWEGFSLHWFGDVVANADIRNATLTSLQVAAVATVCSVVLAIGIALGLAALRRTARGAVMLVAGAPLVLPEIVLAVATLAMFAFLDVPLGMTSVTLAHIAFCVPFALLPIRARLADMDQRVFEAAADLGASPWRVLRRVTLPLLAPGIVAGALMAFIVSLDDFLITFFVAGPGTTTLPIYIYGMLRVGITPAVNALSTLILLVSLLVLAAAYFAGRKRG
ncbi:ABC transporter permease [Microbispora sp. NEAU-D428]|uniref:ABC transporter permease n=1 Tax=Microbispora sitophila TaxID=2771537 RepID=UPI001868F8FE|nr:ABC transporter permease [Microbispora sitophila]MBE3014524.1 ABC transporter permease [Microbispora sitophila]